jgi:hypothetical protein
MRNARVLEDGTARWVEICFCSTPLQEERPYWEEYFELTRIQDAHNRRRCRDKNGSEPWACINCDCTERLERKLAATGKSFLEALRPEISNETALTPEGDSGEFTGTTPTRRGVC